MSRPGFRNLSDRISFKKSKAITIIELLVGTTLFLGISVGAYQVYNKTTQRAQESEKQAKYSRGMKTFLERFRHEVENAVQIPNAMYSALQVARPSRCPDPTNSDSAEHAQNLAWGMIPYPGFSTADFTNSLTPFDPSSVDVDAAGNDNDGVLMISIPAESSVSFLAYSDISTQTLEPSSGNTLIVAGTAPNLDVGDYAIVADAVRKELIRVTGKTVGASNTTIEHSSAKSIWNIDFATGMAAAGPTVGQPIIYRVNIATYALDSNSQSLMKDDHTLDDGFNIQTKNFGSRGLALKWDAVASGITKFQVIYVVGNTTSEKETRKPQIGLPTRTYGDCSIANADANCGCENELGNPMLKTVKTVINNTTVSSNPGAAVAANDSSVESFNPTILKKGLPFMSVDQVGCVTGGNVMYSTLADGTPNPACNSKFCVCSDRYLPSLCDPNTNANHCCGSGATWNGSTCVSNSGGGGTPTTNPGTYGGGGTG